MQGFVLGGTQSGVGKTVATLAVLQALDDDGYIVQPAKAGPDFIDPSHHEGVAGRHSRTLDCWLQGTEGTRRNYYRGDGDICVVEGMMGLYDGDASSTAMVAEALDLPVVLVVDASAGMESVAATALGFREFAIRAEREVEVAGVLLQRAGGGRHEQGIREALPDGLAYFGRIPPREGLEVPERHLGLHRGAEAPLDSETLAAASEHVRTDRLVDIAQEPPKPADDGTNQNGSASDPRIAVASDAAFSFCYPGTMERLRELGSVVTFSPVDGEAVPACDGIYLPGGYPELYAEELSRSRALAELSDRAADGVPILGECGGFMALAESLTTADGERYEMAGVLPADVRMHDRYQALEYVELRASRDGPTAVEGERLRGHEFHYSSADVGSDARFAFDVERGDGIDGEHDGLFEHQTLGTYSHLHAESGAFDRFVESL